MVSLSRFSVRADASVRSSSAGREPIDVAPIPRGPIAGRRHGSRRLGPRGTPAPADVPNGDAPSGVCVEHVGIHGGSKRWMVSAPPPISEQHADPGPDLRGCGREPEGARAMRARIGLAWTSASQTAPAGSAPCCWWQVWWPARWARRRETSGVLSNRNRRPPPGRLTMNTRLASGATSDWSATIFFVQFVAAEPRQPG